MRLRNKPWAVKLVNDHPESVLQNPDPDKKIDTLVELARENFGNINVLNTIMECINDFTRINMSPEAGSNPQVQDVRNMTADHAKLVIPYWIPGRALDVKFGLPKGLERDKTQEQAQQGNYCACFVL